MPLGDYLQKLYDLFRYEDLLLISLAIVVGLVIGAEREYQNKAAGLRTLMLVCVGSCTFTILSLKIGVENPDRLAANIVTGIGFLGAGAIFRDENKISGITTACTIWVTAALGMCIGSGHIYLGLLAAAVVLFVLWSLVGMEQWIDRANKIVVYKITTDYNDNIAGKYEEQFAAAGLQSFRLLELKTEGKLTINWRVKGHEKNHSKVKAALFSDPNIHKIEV